MRQWNKNLKTNMQSDKIVYEIKIFQEKEKH